MTAVSPAFEMVDSVAGLNLNHRKCCWVQSGNDSCQDLLEWVSTHCEEFLEMKIVKHANNVGTMIREKIHSKNGENQRDFHKSSRTTG